METAVLTVTDVATLLGMPLRDLDRRLGRGDIPVWRLDDASPPMLGHRAVRRLLVERCAGQAALLTERLDALRRLRRGEAPAGTGGGLGDERPEITQDVALQLLRRAAECLPEGRWLSERSYDDWRSSALPLVRVTGDQIRCLYGSWNAALVAAGLRTSRTGALGDARERRLDEGAEWLRAAQRATGESPLKGSTYDAYTIPRGGPSAKALAGRHGNSWRRALEHAQLDARPARWRGTRGEALDWVARAIVEIGERVTFTQFTAWSLAQGGPTAVLVREWCGTWTRAKLLARDAVSSHEPTA